MNTDAELARLRAQNAQLQVTSRRYQLLKRAQRNAPAQKQAAVPQPLFQPIDPRRPDAGRAHSRVLPAPSPPLALGIRMGAAIGRELRAMAIEARTLIRSLDRTLKGASAEGLPASAPVVRKVPAVPPSPFAMDAPPADAAQGFEALQYKWRKRFESLAQVWARRLVTDVSAQSTAQLSHGLRGVATLQQIESTLQTPRMRTLVEAAAEASVGLIVRIPQRFLGDVQVQVMSAITTGSGLDKLVPYLTKRYKGDARHAHLVALDQIRKVSESVNATRLQSLGIEEYVWIATGGERYPRKLHHEHLNGETFRYDDPPIIDEKTGERGKPGDAINCRCRARPVLNFTRMVA
jgi:SPP1 gp7 family putative phage head morphogenesis protein